MVLKNGEKVPDQKFFEDVEYDSDLRKFKGIINWNGNSIRGTGNIWKYEFIFSEDFNLIESGTFKDGAGLIPFKDYRNTQDMSNCLAYKIASTTYFI